MKKIWKTFTSLGGEATASTSEPTHMNDAVPTSSTRTARPSHSPTEFRDTYATVDLTSPPKPAKRLAQDIPLPDADQHLLKKHRISPEERRLVPNYSVPADATPVPDPRQYFLNKHRNTSNLAMPKPTSDKSFRPVNTITDVNPHHGQRNHKTYSYKPRAPTAPMFDGQRAYIERQKVNSPQKGSHQQIEGYGSQSVKRRKTDHLKEVITLDEGDEMDEIRVAQPSASPGTVTSRAQRLRSSLSQTNIESNDTPVNGATGLNAPSSGFQMVDRIVDPARKKARRPTINSAWSHETSPRNSFQSSNSTRKGSPGSPVQLFDDDPSPKHESARIAILEDFQQGVTRTSPRRRHNAVQRPVVTSKHFPDPRINLSTSPTGTDIFHPRRGNQSSPSTLRNQFRRTESKEHEEIIDDDEDELQSGLPKSKPASATVRDTSPSKPLHLANTAAKRKLYDKVPSKGWPLVFARTQDFEAYGPDMLLKSGGHETLYRVVRRGEDGNYITEAQITLVFVTEVLADDVSRMRLQGSRGNDGNRYQVDLEFVNPQDFKLFRDHYALLATRSEKVYLREEKHMEKLFKKDLDNNTKVGKSPLVDEIQYTEQPFALSLRDGEQLNNRKSSLLDQLKESAALDTTQIDTKTHATKDGQNDNVQGTMMTRTRPLRSTRSNRSTYDSDAAEFDAPDEDVYKYSVEVGLGKAWEKPLQYGSGRRRALVDFSDLPKLDEGEFLNDSLIDFYLIYLFDQAEVPEAKVYFFNTHFFSSLTRHTPGQKSNINYNAVARWTSKVDIFTYDYIVVPINENVHWYLAIICNVNNIARKPTLNQPAGSKDESSLASILGTAPKASKAGDNVVTSERDDDVNLFDEESKIDVVNVDAVDVSGGVQRTTGKNSLIRTFPVSETTEMQNLSISDSIPKGILADVNSSPASAKKAKRKSGPSPKRWNPEEPVIIILDSLGGATRSKTVRVLKDYIREEGKSKRGMDAVINQNGYYPKDTQIPMQENLSDCGVYLLGYVQKFFNDPDGFKNRMLTGQMTPETDWPDMPMPEMRNKMREIIFGLAKQQDEERKKERAAKRTAKKQAPAPIREEPGSEPSTKSPVGPSKTTLGSLINLEHPSKPEARSVSPPKQIMKNDESPPPPLPRRSPQVVIPQVSPQPQWSSKRPLEKSPLERRLANNQRAMIESAYRSRRLLKKRKMEFDESSRVPPQQPSTTEPLMSQSGSACHPIALDDSQESFDAGSVRSPRQLNIQSRVKETQTSPSYQQRRFSSSTNEVVGPRTNRAHSPSNIRFPGNNLMTHLQNAEAEDRDQYRRARSPAPPERYYGYEDDEDEFEGFRDNPIPTTEWQESTTTDDDTAQDAVVAETPPDKQSSPPFGVSGTWVEGQKLPC